MELASFTSWLVPDIMAQAGAAPGLNRASLINHLRAGVSGGNRLLSFVAWRPLSMLQNPARLTHPLCKLIGETFQGNCLWNTRGRRFSHFSSNLAAPPTVLEHIDIPPTCLLGWSMNQEVITNPPIFRNHVVFNLARRHGVRGFSFVNLLDPSLVNHAKVLAVLFDGEGLDIRFGMYWFIS